jgi:DNA-binding response OmpR family regulator
MPKTILVIDDDPHLRFILQVNLEAAGHQVYLAEDGLEGLVVAREQQPDLVVLDVMMPRLGGFTVCRSLREEPGYPDCSILMLTARGEIEAKGEGFAAGADDYLAKPFDPREVVWRAEALLRRVRRPHLATPPLTCGGLTLYPDSLTVTTPTRQVALTSTEFVVLQALAESGGHVVPVDTLARRIWGEASDEAAASLRVHVNRIRQRLEDQPATPSFLRTVRGRGYVLDPG